MLATHLEHMGRKKPNWGGGIKIRGTGRESPRPGNTLGSCTNIGFAKSLTLNQCAPESFINLNFYLITYLKHEGREA